MLRVLKKSVINQSTNVVSDLTIYEWTDNLHYSLLHFSNLKQQTNLKFELIHSLKLEVILVLVCW